MSPLCTAACQLPGNVRTTKPLDSYLWSDQISEELNIFLQSSYESLLRYETDISTSPELKVKSVQRDFRDLIFVSAV